MDILTNPWVIITLVMAVLIGNIVAFKYMTPKNLDQYKKRDNDIDKLIELDKKHQQALHKDKKPQ